MAERSQDQFSIEISIRARYAETAARHRAAVATAVRGAGAAHVSLRTDTDWVRDLARFVLARRRVPRARVRRIP